MLPDRFARSARLAYTAWRDRPWVVALDALLTAGFVVGLLRAVFL